MMEPTIVVAHFYWNHKITAKIYQDFELGLFGPFTRLVLPDMFQEFYDNFLP